MESLHIVASLGNKAAGRRWKTLFYLIIGKLLPNFAYEKWYWQRPGHRETLALLQQYPFDLIIANDWWSLPAAAEACRKTGARLLLDLHEYAPGNLSINGAGAAYINRWSNIF